MPINKQIATISILLVCAVASGFVAGMAVQSLTGDLSSISGYYHPNENLKPGCTNGLLRSLGNAPLLAKIVFIFFGGGFGYFLIIESIRRRDLDRTKALIIQLCGIFIVITIPIYAWGLSACLP